MDYGVKMSVHIDVHKEEPPDDDYYGNGVLFLENVVGYVIAAVVKQKDGGITLERDVAVYADNFEDNQLAEATVKEIEAKLNEAFPDPNKPEPSKLWVPN
jgi:hypothetical protein